MMVSYLTALTTFSQNGVQVSFLPPNPVSKHQVEQKRLTIAHGFPIGGWSSAYMEFPGFHGKWDHKLSSVKSHQCIILTV